MRYATVVVSLACVLSPLATTGKDVPVTKFFDNDIENLNLMYTQGWISKDELAEMRGEVLAKFCKANPTASACQSGTPTPTPKAKETQVSGKANANSPRNSNPKVPVPNPVSVSANANANPNAAQLKDSWPLESVQCSIGRYTALPCGRGRIAPLAQYRSEKQICDTWNSMCNETKLKLLQIAIPKAASTSLDNVIRRSPLIDPCYVPLCCNGDSNSGGINSGGTINIKLDYDNSPKHEVQYMTNARQLQDTLGVVCTPEPGQCTSQWSLSTKYQQACNYVSAHSSYNDATVAMERGVANVQVVTMMREPVARIQSAFLYTAKLDWGSGKYKLGAHAHPADMDIVEFIATNSLYAGSNLQTRLIAGTPNRHKDQNVTEGMLARAKQNLRKMGFFGIAERFDESVCLLRHSTFGREVLRINDSWDEDAAGPLTTANVRRGQYKRQGLSLSEEQLEKARTSDLLKYDLDLYAYAEKLFQQRLDKVPECHAANIQEQQTGPLVNGGTDSANTKKRKKKKKKKKKRTHSDADTAPKDEL